MRLKVRTPNELPTPRLQSVVLQEAISLADFKLYGAFDTEAYDTLLLRFLRSAVFSIEAKSGVAINYQRLTARYDGGGLIGDFAILPQGVPLVALESASKEVRLEQGLRSVIHLQESYSENEFLEVEYTAGYEPTASDYYATVSDLPENIRACVCEYALFLFESRGRAMEMPLQVQQLMSTFSVNLWF